MDLLQRTFPAEIKSAIATYPPGRQASAVLRLLYLAQAAYGRLTDEAVVEVAELLAMDPTQVRAVVGFYTLFFTEPQGGYVVQFCNDLPCALRGAEALLPKLTEVMGCQPGATSADGLFTLQTVMCLAACDHAPMMQVNLEYFVDLTADRIDEIVTELRAKAATNPPRQAPFGFGPPSAIGAGGGRVADAGLLVEGADHAAEAASAVHPPAKASTKRGARNA